MEIRGSHPFSPSAGLPLNSPFSLRRVSSSVLHYCAAKIINNHKITKKFERKILKNRKNERYSFEFQNYFVILDRKSNLSLYKGSSGDWEMSRVTIWRPFSIPRSALDCFQRTPTQSHQPFL